MKSGVVAIVGRPNVGKSSLFNRLAGSKISIISRHPATTRLKILGVINRDQGQVLLLDTPGFELPRHQLGEFMKKTVLSSLTEADLTLFVISAGGWKKEDEQLLQEVKRLNKKAFLIINKMDILPRKEDLLPLIENSRQRYNFLEIYPCSALHQEKWDTLVKIIFQWLPEGEVFFPEGQVSNLAREYLLAEILREKILEKTYEEVPHSVAVEIEDICPGKTNPEMVVIYARIIVDRKQMKPIILGRNGERIKAIGQKARLEMEQVLGKPVYLQTKVKVIPDWRDRPDVFRRFGYGQF